MNETPEDFTPPSEESADEVVSDQPIDAVGSGDPESEALERALQDAGGEGAVWGRGEALGADEANGIAAERRATVVILAGASNSGKTTLLASLYERFGRGPLAGHNFNGSRTLHGFERRCHRSIHDGGPGGGEQGHTSLSALPWLHMRVSRDDQIYELLLGDYSGERFEALASGREKPSDFPQLRRADHICVVLNGEALADPAAHRAEQNEALALLRALLNEPQSIAGVGGISIVVAKWDLIHAAGDEARGAFESTFAELHKELSARDPAARVGYIETAARSTVSDLPLGHGVDDLLIRWTDRPALAIENPPEGQTYFPIGMRGYRAGMEKR